MSNVYRVDGARSGSATTVSFGERFQSSEQFDHIFKEGMALVERTASYLDGPGRKEAKDLAGGVGVLLGIVTIGALEVISSVYPSGAAFATRSDPMLPPAPPRLSITIGFPSSSCRPFAIGLAAISDGPPGGQGTITFTGRLG